VSAPARIHMIGASRVPAGTEGATEYVRADIASMKRLKDRIDSRLDAYLCEMRPDYDDSITGFNEAWDIVRKAFAEIASV